MVNDASQSRAVPLRAGRRSRRLGRGVAAFAFSLLLVACGEAGDRPAREAEEAAAPQPGGTAVVCVQSQAKSLNPFVTRGQRALDLAPLLYTPLARRDTAREIQPYLARSWSWANGRRRLRLDLRQDMAWHDGSPVTARDVAWTLKTAARPKYYSGASDFSTLDSVTVRDSSTVVVRFAEPFVAGLEPFVDLPVLPRHLLEGIPPEEFAGASYHREPVGSGPFRFVERRPDGSLVFERFEGFPDELGPVYLDRLVVRVIPEPRTMVTEFRVGGVDACITTNSGAGELQEVQDLRIESLRPATVQYVALNTDEAPFRDVRVRRAFSAALDRSAFVSVISPLASPAMSPLSPESPWWAPQFVQPDDDPALADSLLTAAGWTREGDAGIRTTPDGEKLAFTMMAPPQGRDVLTVMQSQLEEVGADVELQFMEFAAYLGRIRNPETRPAAMALGLGKESLRRPDLRLALHSESGDNFSGYGSARLDSLLAVAASATDSQSLRRAYRGIQREVSSAVPYVYTVYVPRGLAVAPRLRGAEPVLSTALATVPEWWIPRSMRRN